MKRYFFISFLLHSMLFMPLAFDRLHERYFRQASEAEKEGGGDSIEIIEFDPLAAGMSKEPEKFYFGIGINESETFNVIKGYGSVWCIVITVVHSGYSASAAGLQAGDVIFQVNHMPISATNDIRGDKPATMLLSVLRKDGRIATIKVPRVKVYY